MKLFKIIIAASLLLTAPLSALAQNDSNKKGFLCEADKADQQVAQFQLQINGKPAVKSGQAAR